MPGSFPDGFDQGLYLPTTEVFDVGDLQEAGVQNENFRELLVRLAQKVNTINTVVNYKSNAFYPLEEFIDGNVWFPDPTLSSASAQTPELRQEFIKVYNVGALLNAATKTIAHGLNLTTTSTFTHIYGTATDTTNNVQVPLPFINTSGVIAAGNIELYADATNIYITPVGDATLFDTCYVVLKWLKN